MAKVTEGQSKESQAKRQGSKKKTALAIGVVCVAAVATVFALTSEKSSPDGSEGAVSQQATVEQNTAPLVLGLTASTDRIAPLDTCELSCQAEDADGDELTFIWQASKGEIVGEGATVQWTAPESEGLFRVSVMVEDSNGGSAEYSTSVPVKQNSAPEFQSMSEVAGSVLADSSTYISFSANDPDGDEVAYEWSATGGELFGQGDSVVWLAPADAGSYGVVVIVRDGYGGEAMREIPINVMADAAPVLGEFLVEAIGHTMLSFDVGVWDIFRGRSCSIECVVAAGTEPYTYEWTADQGVLKADGPLAQWEAPDGKGPATITVAVTDASGKTTMGTVLMYVETCTCHFD